LPADHVGDNEGLDVGKRTVAGPLGSNVTHTVQLVGADHAILADGLFAVVEEQPDGVAGGRMSTVILAQCDEQGGGAGTVVGADEGDVFERVVGFIVAGEDDDAVPLARKFDDVVVHPHWADGGGGGEGVVDQVAMGGFGGEVGLDEVFRGDVAGRGDVAPGGNVDVLLGEAQDLGARDGVRLGVGGGGEQSEGEEVAEFHGGPGEECRGKSVERRENLLRREALLPVLSTLSSLHSISWRVSSCGGRGGPGTRWRRR
jgi:hypothetical protein